MDCTPVILAHVIVVLVLVRFNPSSVTQITCAGLLYWFREDFVSKGMVCPCFQLRPFGIKYKSRSVFNLQCGILCNHEHHNISFKNTWTNFWKFACFPKNCAHEYYSVLNFFCIRCYVHLALDLIYTRFGCNWTFR